MRIVATSIICALAFATLAGCDQRGTPGKDTADVPPPANVPEPETKAAAWTPSVSAVKMNVFYIGVENPLEIAAGVASDEIVASVSGAGAKLRKVGARRYVVTVTEPGECVVTVKRVGHSGNRRCAFRAKRIPDPVARLGKSSGGAMGSGEFKAQAGVLAVLPDFDFDARASITGFELVYLGKRMDPVTVQNSGARFNAQAKRLVGRAKPGDIFIFQNVRARCPGDPSSRRINSMAFTIR